MLSRDQIIAELEIAKQKLEAAEEIVYDETQPDEEGYIPPHERDQQWQASYAAVIHADEEVEQWEEVLKEFDKDIAHDDTPTSGKILKREYLGGLKLYCAQEKREEDRRNKRHLNQRQIRQRDALRRFRQSKNLYKSGERWPIEDMELPTPLTINWEDWEGFAMKIDADIDPESPNFYNEAWEECYAA